MDRHCRLIPEGLVFHWLW